MDDLGVKGGITPRKRMAMGDSSTGSTPAANGMNGGTIIHPDAGMDTGKVMVEGTRGILAPTTGGPGRMATMGTADHGPHNHSAGKIR